MLSLVYRARRGESCHPKQRRTFAVPFGCLVKPIPQHAEAPNGGWKDIVLSMGPKSQQGKLG